MGAQTCRTYLKDGINALALRIPDRPKSIPRDRTRQQARHVGDDETQRAAAQAADDAPELARRLPRSRFGHPFLAQHLLEHVAELRVLRLLARLGLGRPAGEEVPRPRVCVLAGAGTGIFAR